MRYPQFPELRSFTENHNQDQLRCKRDGGHQVIFFIPQSTKGKQWLKLKRTSMAIPSIISFCRVIIPRIGAINSKVQSKEKGGVIAPPF